MTQKETKMFWSNYSFVAFVAIVFKKTLDQERANPMLAREKGVRGDQINILNKREFSSFNIISIKYTKLAGLKNSEYFQLYYLPLK